MFVVREKNRLTVAVLIAVVACAAFAGRGNCDTVPFDSDRWEITGTKSTLTTHLGRECVMLQGGSATLNDVSFTDGVIEFDIAFTADRGFSGVMWRVQDDDNFEHFYMRPHQSGMPDANQYTPVFNGVAGWQLYHGPSYGTPIDYAFDAWIPVKVVVSGMQADVYVRDMETPLLHIQELKRGPDGGRVGVNASSFAPAWFSNFRVDTAARPPLSGTAAAVEAAPAHTVASWLVSDAFAEESLKDVSSLVAASYASMNWTRLETEPPGMANIARVRALSATTNTVFARLVITSDRDQGKLLRFGYSDRARVFFNDRLIYVGDNGYRSRDYRYLGTIGLFDGLYIPLREGRNELWIAVSESFGGWGVMAQFADTDGIVLESIE